MKEKMIPAFRKAEGGLFTAVEKADVGSAYQEMEKQGVALMGWADPFMPDASMPKHVEQALIDAIRHPSAPHYTAPIGSSQLKAKIAEKLKTKNHLLVDPEGNILITPGSDSGLYFAILPFIEDGDEVLIPSPSYPNNTLNIEIMGGRVVPVPLRPETGYQLEAELLEQSVSEKTKMIVLTHPNNPTTTVYNRQSLEILRDFVIRHDLILVCDQAFEDFCYENEMITPAAMDGMFERTVTVFSFSKGMGLSGLRVGYLVCGDEIMDSLYANAVSVLGATNTACQKALIAALEDPSFMQEFERAFDIRRQAAEKILNSIPNVHADLPQSGFLCWVDVSRLGDSSQIVQYLVKHAQVAVNDGKNYGPGGEGHLRIVLGVYRDDAKVIAALERIKAALIQWQEENHV
ncbi:pyridoxal phosphate-dependent aminotransferase [Holdemania filiformis]|uniref:Aminotransferase n=1 Tax=Holdemania filiformis TaxID=61171 RepID=A0A412FMZ5_9FIRM|nr:pyridoxal phosphate-dependent aminotransferase [Holdemania filiformis]MBS5000746.1 pyridoxal phosphate-dependent aminotransferase [Holdemania filiformis]RGR69542.1 pyridoxal phosphate-dependent aminotransferase [Holdemania filiformis]